VLLVDAERPRVLGVAGGAYQPEAYSGRISLHSAITSDWQQVQVMLRPGLERVPDSTLLAVLDLVRGAPLADAAPGQWYWAEELRTEISAALRDVGVDLMPETIELCQRVIEGQLRARA